MDTTQKPADGNVQCEVDDVPVNMNNNNWTDAQTLHCNWAYGGPPPTKVEIKYIATPDKIFCDNDLPTPPYDWTEIPLGP